MIHDESNQPRPDTLISTEKKHDPQFDRLRMLATSIQKITNTPLDDEHNFFITHNKYRPEAGTFYIDRGKNKVIVNLAADESLHVVGHELAHTIIDRRISAISDDWRVRNALTEGLCDLASYEAVAKLGIAETIPKLNPDISDFTAAPHEQPPPEAINAYLKSGNYQDPPRFGPGTGASTDHVVGRYFITNITASFPNLHCAELIERLEQHPPSREDMLNPSNWGQRSNLSTEMDLHKDRESPVQSYFCDAPKRIF
ncbi:hypothetical protein COT52_00165 [candidate division WWE3 bacterium CG08_land_8_20_14_0_20_43_13]|uniref:Uncharacterized protein n=1 Tax=candidate division WWE3 bacterium CG08_land_8_20_14_0_20_43_13 TaxID=1975087 RepID=A0A2H0X871_UNCKA|nr:MAG: hypothetical protein COT52_00165 [candidate division WWE3 bacterium CG08_land_8_20_14_0_20_43_13]